MCRTTTQRRGVEVTRSLDMSFGQMDRTSQQGERRARERTGPPKVPSIGTGLLRGEASDADVSAIDSGQRPLAQGQALIVFIAAKPLGKNNTRVKRAMWSAFAGKLRGNWRAPLQNGTWQCCKVGNGNQNVTYVPDTPCMP